MLNDEVHYKILKIIEVRPDISQRDLARELGVSVGKANFCLRALIARGLIKANNFKNNDNKKAYKYYLARRGIIDRAHVTTRFLSIKMAEYEALKREISSLQRETQK